MKINITEEWESSQCECCGWSDYATATIHFEDDREIVVQYDGHLGGGEWNGSTEHLYKMILDELNVEIETDYKRVEEEDYEGF